MSKVEAPNCVTIFGGGVAGLTAAHELVERGFRVQVWEKEMDQRQPWRGCVVGGMARTQWSRVHWPETLDATDPWPRIEPLGIEVRCGVEDGNSDWSNQWYGVTGTGHAPLDQNAALEMLTRALFLGDLDVNDEEPNLDVVAYSRPKQSLRPQGELKGEQAALQEQVLQQSSRDAREKALEFLRLIPGFNDKLMHIARVRGNAMRVRIITELEPEWIAEVTEASIRLEFFYTPPWGQPSAPIVHIPQKFYYKRTDAAPPSTRTEEALNALPDTPSGKCRENYKTLALGECGVGEPTDVVREFMELLANSKDIRHVYVEVADRRWWDETGERLDVGWDTELASCIQKEFERILLAIQPIALRDVPGTKYFPWDSSKVHQTSDRRTLYNALRLPNGRIIVFTAVRLNYFPYKYEAIDVFLQFRVREFWLPGEHGYRFFPSFYHHVFDTMRRTPILEGIEKSLTAQAQEHAVYVTPDRTKYIESFRTVFDNLKSQRFTALAFADGKRPTLINRAALDSMEEAVEVFKTLIGQPEEGGVGFNTRDWSRFTLRFLQYLSSSPARREEYERISWWDFVEGPTYAPNSQAALVRFPKALVAMDAVEADARTIGSSGAQTLLDQFKKSSEFRDGTLKGPTSEAWFKYWRRYLEAQGVEFIHGKLNRLVRRTSLTEELDPDGKPIAVERVWPDVECYEPRFHFENIGTDDKPDLRPCLMPGYFVLALSADEVKRVAQNFYGSADARVHCPHRDLERAAELELGNPQDQVPSGELRHFAGIQYFFEEDVLWIDGHVYFPHSPWAITSISQSRFWEDKQDWEHGYRGILSAIIGKWDVPGDLLGKTAWDCTPDELAREVWYQVSKAMEQTPSTRLFDGRPPRPIFWHLDDSMRFDEAKTPHWTNHTPFQIETPGRYHKRPGDLGGLGYSTELGVGLCGTYMKTHTRITSMEAANESARHVVNAILADVASPFRRTPCDISPIEAREIRDFDFLKEVDAELHQRGLPHVLDIIGVDRFLREWWPDDESFVREPLMLMERFRQLLRQWIKDHHPGRF